MIQKQLRMFSIAASQNRHPKGHIRISQAEGCMLSERQGINEEALKRGFQLHGRMSTSHPAAPGSNTWPSS